MRKPDVVLGIRRDDRQLERVIHGAEITGSTEMLLARLRIPALAAAAATEAEAAGHISQHYVALSRSVVNRGNNLPVCSLPQFPIAVQMLVSIRSLVRFFLYLQPFVASLRQDHRQKWQ